MVETEDGRKPVALTVRSRLLGPFFAPPVEADAPPADAAVVCEVQTTVTAPGGYETPPCTLPGVGYFVWVESISPVDTVVGGEKLLPWQGRFGVASETTLVPFAPVIETVATPRTAAVGECVADRLIVSRLNPGVAELAVESILWGPFAEAPASGSALPEGARRVASVSTPIAGEGERTTECIVVTQPGHYVFTYASSGSADGAIPPFEDRTVHEAETVIVREELAATGASTGMTAALLTALGTVGTGVLLLARRRHAAAGRVTRRTPRPRSGGNRRSDSSGWTRRTPVRSA